MSAIPERDLSAVHEYCANRIPPEHQNEVRVEYSQHGTNLTIHECRPPWRPDLGPEWTRQPVAQLRYTAGNGLWTLYCADRNGRWHPYHQSKPTNRVTELLDEITDDPTGIFWG
jgi:hypothetical protein